MLNFLKIFVSFILQFKRIYSGPTDENSIKLIFSTDIHLNSTLAMCLVLNDNKYYYMMKKIVYFLAERVLKIYHILKCISYIQNVRNHCFTKKNKNWKKCKFSVRNIAFPRKNKIGEIREIDRYKINKIKDFSPLEWQ